MFSNMPMTPASKILLFTLYFTFHLERIGTLVTVLAAPAAFLIIFHFLKRSEWHYTVILSVGIDKTLAERSFKENVYFLLSYAIFSGTMNMIDHFVESELAKSLPCANASTPTLHHCTCTYSTDPSRPLRQPFQVFCNSKITLDPYIVGKPRRRKNPPTMR